MKKLLFVLISIGLLLVTLMFVWSNTAATPVSKTDEQVKVEEPKAIAPRILVAKYPIQVGSLLRSQDFTWAPFDDSEHQLIDLFLKDFVELKSLEGSLITQSLVAGQPLTSSVIIRPEQSHYLSSMLAPGMKGVTLDITFAGSNYGLIRAGNYVDIILTTTKKHHDDEGFGEVTKHANNLVLENVRLLAVDNVLTDILSGPEKQDSSSSLNQNGERTIPVTFEVAADQAQRLLLARKLGALSLLLRSAYQDSSLAQSDNVTLWDEEISDNHNPRMRPQHSIRIFDGQDVRTQEKPTAR
ncbi:Flp pilus assembly protein CpaB [Vibrio sp. vnigr-6D03]|uniref:Flp pilus assembly protein CpaB n=1 Tax=Vibrio sp. vnigr-6D03 TaxID=2058088 RepID=UPI000C34A5D9|nr:Flp pilus assembly protein CpaB [Vibrio sp. vnigr-6D03]PKF77409.1 Flp pilus assembly protein CpaB [Vibrio sp. vnigr-6D03]